MRLLIPCREMPGCFDGIINTDHIVDLYTDYDYDCHVSKLHVSTTLGDNILLCKSDYRRIKMLFEYLVSELSGNMNCGIIDLEAKYKQIKEEEERE